mmetsp:Transcript_7642/g.19597  ORF Transcript_7642/g.19597 Transcript_7642/m.19597 type:complete len:215 (+) Transcript_7642:18-662(+)
MYSTILLTYMKTRMGPRPPARQPRALWGESDAGHSIPNVSRYVYRSEPTGSTVSRLPPSPPEGEGRRAVPSFAARGPSRGLAPTGHPCHQPTSPTFEKQKTRPPLTRQAQWALPLRDMAAVPHRAASPFRGFGSARIIRSTVPCPKQRPQGLIARVLVVASSPFRPRQRASHPLSEGWAPLPNAGLSRPARPFSGLRRVGPPHRRACRRGRRRG